MSNNPTPASTAVASNRRDPADGQSATRRNRPGNLRRRLLRHYLPIAAASTIALVVGMNIAYFDANRYPHAADIMVEGFSGAFGPQGGTPMGAEMHEPERPVTEAGGDEPDSQTQHGAGDAPPDGEGDSPMQHSGGASSGGSTMQHGPGSNPDAQQATVPEPGGDDQGMADHEAPGGRERLMREYSVVTGYIALVLLAITLLVGPVNLMRRRQTPLSSYLTRDVGIVAATVSIAHVIFGFLVDHSDGILGYFFEPDDRSRILTTSFGLANWTGLAAVVIVAALAAISSDRALRALKARRWKRIQRLNYVLFPLVIAHAVLYGALLRITSPYTALLGVSAVAVLAGQLIGIRLWRRRRAAA
jgi:sulfoxide reductase heme-binding subunit YedZ